MKFRFIWVGKTKDKNYLALQDEYLQRLSHFVKCETVEVKDSAAHEGTEVDGKRILDKVNPSSVVCLLDVTGRSFSSQQLANEVEKWQNTSVKDVTFVIGGADGVSAAVAERADLRLSLSFLTFTHEMARVIILEQLYRAYTIIKGYPYQK
ncbi:MAG: 23S rRNA (pseudouridine(1915)-N(3))-methyltransferase RlmH [Pyrinomonadaceae bacterium]